MSAGNPMHEVIETLDEVTDPKRMSKADYVEFLGELIDDLEMRKQCAEQEISDEGVES